MNGVAGRGVSAAAVAECARARPLLGTMVEVVARGAGSGAVQSAVEKAFQAMETVHRLMSYHDADSDVSLINREAARRAVTVDARTWQVLHAACEFSHASDGLFDVTVAPTLTALGFLPRHADFPRASAKGDWRHIELLSGRRVRLKRCVRIDLGGIAKGYAVDCAIEALRAGGMHAARVNAGGDLRLFGPQVQTIHVRRPGAPTELLPITELANGAVATSADYFSARRQRGRWITPLIQPRTRISCPAGRSVTVLAPDCMTADALTKVVHAGPWQAIATLRRFGARVLILEQENASATCKLYDSDTGGAQTSRSSRQPDMAHV